MKSLTRCRKQGDAASKQSGEKLGSRNHHSLVVKMHRDENSVALKCAESNLPDVGRRGIDAFSEPFDSVKLQERRIFLADHRQSPTNIAYIII